MSTVDFTHFHARSPWPETWYNDYVQFISKEWFFACSTPSEDKITQLLCSRCLNPPSILWYNKMPTTQHIIRLECYECRELRNVCITCPVALCNQDFKKFSTKRTSKRVIDLLMNEEINTHVLHCALCDQANNPSTHSIGDTEIVVREETNSNVENNNQNILTSLEQQVNAMLSSSDVLDTNQRLSDAIMHRESSKDYAQHLILKYWMKTGDGNLRKEDVQLFLRVVKVMNQSTRDEMVDLAFIIDAIILQHEKETENLLKEQRKLMNTINTLQDEISSLKTQLQAHHIIPCVDESVEQLRTCPETINNDRFYLDIPLPRSVKQMRCILETTKGFMSSCLIPTIKMSDSGSAYILPSDALRIGLCTGVPIEYVWGKQYDINTLDLRSVFRCQDIQTKVSTSEVLDNELTVALGYWSDGCICGTDSKGGRNSAKTVTIHIAHPKTTMQHVFPLCFSTKESKLSDVLEIVLNDMRNLCVNGMKCYIPGVHKFVNVRFIFAYAIQDRPEHSETTGFMSSGGTFSKRVGISCPVVVKRTGGSGNNGSTAIDDTNNTQVLCEKQLASCSVCQRNRILNFCNGHLQSASTSSQRCMSCYDWDMSNVKYKPTKDYPLDILPPELVQNRTANDVGFILEAKEITFATMKEACEVILKKVYEKKWTLKVVEQFARTECIRQETWKKVYDYAVSIRNVPENNPSLPEVLLPPFWKQDIIAMDSIHLGVMHYLFLNVGSHLIQCIKEKLKGHQWRHVHNVWNNTLLEIRSLSLSWCKCWNLGSKEKPTSVWVSENYVGFSMVCKTLALSLRSLEEVTSDMDLVEDACNAYYCLVSYVMSATPPTDTTISAVSALSKIFLTSVQLLDNAVYKEKDDNKIETASCFVNLLSLSAKMKRFGVVRNYWEGGVNGEGIFLQMKGFVRRGLHSKGACKAMMKKLYQQRSLDELIASHSNHESYHSFIDAHISQTQDDQRDDDEEITPFDTSRYRRFHAYESIQIVNDKIQQFQPVAVLWSVSTSSFYILMGRRKRKKTLTKISFCHETMYMNTKVFNVEVEETAHDIGEVSSDSNNYVSCILLPIFHKDVVEQEGGHAVVVRKKYYLISEEHKEYGRGSRFTFPSLNHVEERRQQETQVHLAALLSEAEYLFCGDKDRCRQLIGQRVQSIDGYAFAKVQKFKHVGNIPNSDHAVWTVAFYDTDTCRRAKATKEVKFLELKQLLLNRLNL